MLDRQRAWKLVKQHLHTEYLLKHLIASEACMRAIAKRLGEDENLWGITGLVHDIDLDLVKDDMKKHGLEGARILKENGFPEELQNAVLAHAEQKEAKTRLEKALCAVDPTTGFIVASVLVRPDRKIAGLEVRSVKKRMKEKRFAANVNRDKISSCEELGITLDEFLIICINALKEVSTQLGL